MEWAMNGRWMMKRPREMCIHDISDRPTKKELNLHRERQLNRQRATNEKKKEIVH
jgi:hypothetical protein